MGQLEPLLQGLGRSPAAVRLQLLLGVLQRHPHLGRGRRAALEGRGQPLPAAGDPPGNCGGEHRAFGAPEKRKKTKEKTLHNLILLVTGAEVNRRGGIPVL